MTSGIAAVARISRALRLSVAIVLLGSCASDRIAREETSAAFERFRANGGKTARSYAAVPMTADGSTKEPPAETPEFVSDATGSASPSPLRAFILESLQRSPEIREAEALVRASVERVRQVTSLTDPMLMTKTLPEPVRTAEGDNHFILGVSQKLPVPKKLDLAGRIALQDARVALSSLQETRLAVIADVKRAYYQLYVTDRSVDILRANQEILRGLIDVARIQVATGKRSQDDVLRAQVELSNLRAEVVRLRQQRITIVARLNQLGDRAPGVEIESPESFVIRSVDMTVDALFERASAANPELEKTRQRIERDKASLELAKLAHWPDFTIGFEWMSMEPRDAFEPPRNPTTGRRPASPQLSEDGSDNWAITFGFNLPIWFDRIEGGIEEARQRLAASERRRLSTENRVHFAIADALGRVRSQQELAVLFRDAIVPQAEQTYRVSQSSYAVGDTDFLSVVDNWRTWLSFNIQFHRSLAELEKSVADLEQAIGLSLQEVGSEP